VGYCAEYKDFVKDILLSEFDEYLEECSKNSIMDHQIDPKEIKAKSKVYKQKQL